MRSQGVVSIPSSNEGDDCHVILFLVPNAGWVAPVFSVVSSLTAGRTWDGATGKVTAAQEVAEQVMNSFTTCSLSDIVAAIDRIGVQFAINSVCCDGITQPVIVDDPPPTPGVEPPPSWVGGGQTEWESALCMLVNIVRQMVTRYAEFLENVNVVATTALLIVSALGVIFPEPITTVIGSVSFAAIATILLSAVAYTDAIQESSTGFQQWINENTQDLYCSMLQATDVATAIHDYFQAAAIAFRSFLLSHGAPQWVADGITAWLSYNQIVGVLAEKLIDNTLSDFAAWLGVTPVPCVPCPQYEGWFIKAVTHGWCGESDVQTVSAGVNFLDVEYSISRQTQYGSYLLIMRNEELRDTLSTLLMETRNGVGMGQLTVKIKHGGGTFSSAIVLDAPLQVNVTAVTSIELKIERAFNTACPVVGDYQLTVV